MTVFAFFLFASLCLFVIGEGLRRKTAFIEFPCLAGFAILGVLLLQAVGLLRQPELVPDGSLAKLLVMFTLCVLALHLGWRRTPGSVQARPVSVYSMRSVFWLGMAFSAIGMFGFYRLTRLSGGLAQHFSTTGHYTLAWSGLPVVYVFFMSYLSPGIFLSAAAALRLRSRGRLAIAAVFFLIPLAFVVFLGRRGHLVDSVALVACALYFGRNITLPRAPLVVLALLGIVGIYVAPYYRSHSEIGADTEKLRDIDAAGTMSSVVTGAEAEVYNGAWTVALTERQGTFEYGIGIYNFLVSCFVPKLVVGPEFKQSLFIDPPVGEGVTEWRIAYGGNITGPASAFKQFWYFGCACFYLMARLMRVLYDRARLQNDLFAQTLYTACLAWALQAVVNYMYLVLNPLVMFGPVLYVLFSIPGIKRRVADGGSARRSPNRALQYVGDH